MKKVLLTTLAFMAISTAAVAQHHEEGKTKVSFGVKAGFNQTIVTKVDDIVGKSGFHIGGVAEAKFSKRFALQGEILYATMGGKLENSYFSCISPSYSGKIKLNYIAIPIMAKVFITEGLNIQLGPQFNFAVKTEREVNNTTDNMDGLINKFDLGLNAGLGYDFRNNLFIDMRTSFGLIDVFKDIPTSNKNFAFMVGIGYKFN